MKLLLDTHIFLWMALNPNQIPAKLRGELAQATQEVVLSAASLWEIQIKYQAGKLQLPSPASTFAATQINLRAIQVLPVYQQHVWAVDNLPFHHRDPFDRLLIAQAMVEGYQLATLDSVFQHYPVDLFPA